MDDEIKALKDEEKGNDLYDWDQFTDTPKKEQDHDSLGGRFPVWIGVMLVAVGIFSLIGFISPAETGNVDWPEQSRNIWHFWWLIFFIKPFFWGWGYRGRHRYGRRC